MFGPSQNNSGPTKGQNILYFTNLHTVKTGALMHATNQEIKFWSKGTQYIDSRF